MPPHQVLARDYSRLPVPPMSAFGPTSAVRVPGFGLGVPDRPVPARASSRGTRATAGTYLDATSVTSRPECRADTKGETVDLIGVLKNPPAKAGNGRSVMDVWADSLSEGERAAVYAAAANPDWGHVALRDVLAAAGAPKLSDNSLRSWRVKQGWHRGA